MLILAEETSIERDIRRRPPSMRDRWLLATAAILVAAAARCGVSAQGGIPFDLGGMMGGGGGGKPCVFKCPGGVAPRPRDGHTPTFNGCGVPGFQVESKFGMTECCNEHDRCYHTCKTGGDQKKGQKICDDAFEACKLRLPIPRLPVRPAQSPMHARSVQGLTSALVHTRNARFVANKPRSYARVRTRAKV